MQYRQLGNTNIQVSALCLGTMTWGEQNTQDEAHEQLNYALSQGINFIDTAELYPVPPNATTQGLTEQYIGTWLKARAKRDDVIIATKIAGPSSVGFAEHFRDGKSTHNVSNIQLAVDASLKRLQTDYIDLYQLHWPDRPTNFFGKLGYQHQPNQSDGTPILETLHALQQLVQVGKIRHIGLSNETPWGLSQFVHLANQHQLPKVQSIQNPYSLLNRSFEIGLAEMAIRDQVGLLAYSPLGFGVLTGKYLNGQQPQGARLTRWARFGRYNTPLAQSTTAQYVALAQQYGLNPAQMALAFVTQQPFVTSNIIGATSLAQLKTNIDSINVTLGAEVLAQIEAIHTAQPNPAP